MGAMAKLKARIAELEKRADALSVLRPREYLSSTLEVRNLVSRYNALAEAKANIIFELAPIPGTAPLTMNLMMLFEVSLMRVAQTACDFFRKHDDAEEAAVMGEFRSALLTREAEPVEITLTVEDGAATLTAFTAACIAHSEKFLPDLPGGYIVCGGGRRNPAMMQALRERLEADVVTAEDAGWRGDDLEAECFAYLAVRTLKKLPISYPKTTRVPSPMRGGVYHRAPV